MSDQNPSEDQPQDPAADVAAPSGSADTPEASDASATAVDSGSTADVTDGDGSGDEEAPEVEVRPIAEPAEPKYGYIWGTGRRKTSVARVRLRNGSGKIEVNGKDYKVFFPTSESQNRVTSPMAATETLGKYDVWINVNGGGITGQSGAVALGIGRALRAIEPHLEPALREGGFLTRDSRMKERKKYGLRGARRAFQFSKR